MRMQSWNDAFDNRKEFDLPSPSQSQSTSTTYTKSNITKSENLVFISIWTGQEPPRYLPQILSNIARNPTMNLLFIATDSAQSLCSKTAIDSYQFSGESNIQLSCLDYQDIRIRFVETMCKQWRCSTDESREVQQGVAMVLDREPYRINDFKPLWFSAFTDLVWKHFPANSFTHWGRLDIDTLIGDYERNMPWNLLDHDVVSFQPSLVQSPRETIFRGYFSIFRISSKMNNLWSRMEFFTDPAAFLTNAKDSPRFSSLDEGQFSKLVIQTTDISFLLIPGLVYLDDEASFQRAKFTIYGHHNELIVTYPQAQDYLNERLVLESAERFDVQYEQDVLFPESKLGPLRFGADCPMLWWFKEEDRLCPEDDTIPLNSSEGFGSIVRRASGSKDTYVQSVYNPGNIGMGSHIRRALAVHLTHLKRAADLDFVFGKHGHILEPGEKWEILHTPEDELHALFYRLTDAHSFTQIWEQFLPITKPQLKVE